MIGIKYFQKLTGHSRNADYQHIYLAVSRKIRK